MEINLPLILVIATAASGIVWLVDSLLLLPGRRRGARSIDELATLTDDARLAKQQQVLREPMPVEFARALFPVFLVILLVRSFVVEPFRIPSGSMIPTLVVGDFILVNKFAYGLRLPVGHRKIIPIGEPARGDVVVFRYPENPRQDYIKRVIGVPGDEISYRGDVLYLNGQRVQADYIGPYEESSDPAGRGLSGSELFQEHLPGRPHRILETPAARSTLEGSWTVQDGQYFVMGDNRDNSLDSRYWGFVPEGNLVGKAMVVWLSYAGGFDVDRIGTLIK